MTWPKLSYTLTWGRTQEGSWALVSAWANLQGGGASVWSPTPAHPSGRLARGKGVLGVGALAPKLGGRAAPVVLQRKTAP